MDYKEVLKFWFEEVDSKNHFIKNKEVDTQIIKRFTDLHTKAVGGGLNHWTETPEGTLALVIVLDQFSRNMFRDDARSYAQDELALKIAMNSVDRGFDKVLPKEQRLFMYMPYMHSESKEVHKKAVSLFEALGNELSLKYEHIHKDIIDEFGRYPHRNNVIGRESTPKEKEYLANNSESFF